MKYVSIDQVKPGDIVSKTIYGMDRKPLIGSNVVLTDRYIERLVSIGICGIYIIDPDLEGVEIEQGLDDQFKLEAIGRLQKIFQDVEKLNKIQAKEAIQLANEITDHILPKRDFIVQLKDIRLKSSFLYSHSINVAMLAVLTARGLGYNPMMIKQVAVGALLHDIGFAKGKDRTAHSLAGFELLRREHEIPLLSAHMVLQHHEAIDGSGYPFKTSGEQVRDASQICAVCNDFDNIVNSLENSLLPHDGIEYVMARADHFYKVDIVRHFIQYIAPYPVGTKVKLSNQSIGKVLHVSKVLPMRPIVRLENGEVIDLANERTVLVEKVIQEYR